MPRRRSKIFTSRNRLQRSRAGKLYQVGGMSPLSDLAGLETPSSLGVLAKGYDAELKGLGYGGLMGAIKTWQAEHENMQAFLQFIGSLRDIELAARQSMFRIIQDEPVQKLRILAAERMLRFRTEVGLAEMLEREPLVKLGILAETRLQIFEKQVRFSALKVSVEQELEIQRIRDQYALDLAEEHTVRTFQAVLDMMRGSNETMEELGFTPEQIADLVPLMMEFMVEASSKILMEALKRNEDKGFSYEGKESPLE